MISVLIPVCNGQKFVAEAVRSILTQTLTDLDVIVIDDGSTDDTPTILEGVGDSRLRVIRHERSLGVSTSLNEALETSKSRYVARMDGDDIAEPNRLARQLKLLRDDPRIGLCGTNAAVIDAKGQIIGRRRYQVDPDVIHFQSKFSPPFLHPSVLIDRERVPKIELKYDENIRYAQDFEIWYRLLNHCQGSNIPEPLTRYRIHGNSITSSKRQAQLQFQDDLIIRAFRNEGVTLLPAEASKLRWLISGGERNDQPAGPAVAKLRELIGRNRPSSKVLQWLLTTISKNAVRSGVATDLTLIARFAWALAR